MIRQVAPLTLVAILSAAAFACEKPGAMEEQKETKANEQAIEARNEAQQKENTAQAQATKDIAAAQTDFAKAREDYRHGRWTDLANLDKRIIDLQTREQTVTGKAKADLDVALPTIRQKREVFVRDVQGLDSATGASWDEQKANVDKEWDSLRSAVDDVR